jgi:hypothetical protein
MFDSLRHRFGVPGVIAVIALVAALVTGGAYAASGGFTKKQVKEIEKIAKKSGKPGPAGPPGTSGTNGTNGTSGTKGETGAQGIQGIQGLPGTNGANATFEYLFNTGTAGDPTSGKLGLNNATPGSATAVRVSETDHESATNIAAAIAKWISGPGAKGTLMIRKVASQSTYAQYTIVGNKDEGAFDSLEVAFVSGNGTFANSDPVTVQYFASAGTTLASGASETGTWTISQLNIPVTTSERLGAISFPIPLATTAQVVFIDRAETESEAEPEGCRWKEFETNPNSKPEATHPGTLCVFTQIENLEHASFLFPLSPGVGEIGTAGPAGVYLGYTVEGEPATPAVVNEDGVWAVTAP